LSFAIIQGCLDKQHGRSVSLFKRDKSNVSPQSVFLGGAFIAIVQATESRMRKNPTPSR